ncbi:MAG: transaldolase family protein [Bacteroidota bacterium]
MELYLDSADVVEIKEAFNLGFLNGLTTTPTFMHRHGITNIDETIIELSNIVPVLQIEALGSDVDSILSEVHRQNDLGLDKSKTVYKIPISLEGVKACKKLTDDGFMVNIHLVYTLQQAYMAMAAGATYVCPLVGRLQDQGHDALQLIDQCVQAVNYYGYNSKIMFSSVRNIEHVRNALNIGVHTITAPWKVIQQMSKNNLTDLGTQQFVEHTRLMTYKIKDILDGENPVVTVDNTISECLLQMTVGGFGAVTIVDAKGEAVGIFTDGDLRRLIANKGGDSVTKKVGEILTLIKPFTIDENELLFEANSIFQKNPINSIVVTRNNKVTGMIHIQDIVGMER